METVSCREREIKWLSDNCTFYTDRLYIHAIAFSGQSNHLEEDIDCRKWNGNHPPGCHWQSLTKIASIPVATTWSTSLSGAVAKDILTANKNKLLSVWAYGSVSYEMIQKPICNR
jgi:ABC-type sugar transport system substrate-binding protein